MCKNVEIVANVCFSETVQQAIEEEIALKRKKLKKNNKENIELSSSIRRLYMSLQNEIDVQKYLKKRIRVVDTLKTGEKS
jgi:hypothetical protein